MGATLADDPYSGKMAGWWGKKCRVKIQVCMWWVGVWERDFDICECSGSCDLNPKKEIVCGGESSDWQQSSL